MRVLFTVTASPTHLQNLVPLGWALRAAGHQVCVASQPDLTEAIRATGLTAVAAGEPLDFAERFRNVPPGRQILESGYHMGEMRESVLTWDYLLGMYDDYLHGPLSIETMSDQTVLDSLVRFAEWWKPDIVVWDAFTFAGGTLAKIIGVPSVRVLWALDHWARMRAIFLATQERTGSTTDPVASWLGKKLEPYGRDFSEDASLGHITIDPMPASMRYPVDLDYRSMQFIPYNGPAAVEPWLGAPPTRPRVCVTLGISRRLTSHDGRSVEQVLGTPVPAEEVLRSIAGLGVEVVATLNSDQLATGTSLPDNVRLVDFVPLNELLPTCSAIVHHGGTGTTMNAVVHGVPQVIVPGPVWDEVHKAEHFHSRDAGRLVPADTLTPRSVQDAVAEALDPAVAANAADIRQECLAAPSPHDLVPQLEELAG